MKAKVLLLAMAMIFSFALPSFAQHRTVATSNGGRTFVGNNFNRSFVGNNFNRYRCHGGGTTWSIGIGLPFYGGWYGGSPFYGGYYPYGGYGYGYYPYSGYGYGYGSGYYGSPYGSSYYGRPVYGGDYRGSYRGGGSTVARVQERLARAGYYTGSIDGIIGPRTRSAIRAYERRHGLPIDGVIDSRLLATMGLA